MLHLSCRLSVAPCRLLWMAMGLSACGTASDKAPPQTGASDSAPVDPDSDAPPDRPIPDDTGGGRPSRTLLITELMSNNDGALVAEDGSTPDWIELHNPGTESVDLSGFTLSDNGGDGGAPFSEDQIPPGGFFVVYANGDALPFRLSSEGESLTLRDAAGGLVDQIEFGPLPPDVSVGRAQAVDEEVLLTDGAEARFAGGRPTDWSDPNTDDTTWQAVQLPIGFGQTLPARSDLALFASTTQSSDGYGFTGLQAVDGDLSTFSHTGDADLAPWWQVELEAPAAVSEVVLHNRVGCCADRLYHLVVELRDEAGEAVWASDTLNPVPEGATPTSPGSALTIPIDPPVSGQQIRVSKTAVNGPHSSEWLSLAEVEVTGIPASPDDTRVRTDVETALVDGEGVVRVWLPATEARTGLLLEARVDDGVEVVLHGEPVLAHNLAPTEPVEASTALRRWIPPAPDGGLLAARLVDADGADALLGLTLTAVSVETDADSLRTFPTATPGAPNGPGVDGILAAPTFDPPRQWLDGPTELEVRAPEGAMLVYTLDGTVPTIDTGRVAPSGRLDLTLANTTLLRAVAVQDGWEDSPVVTHTYLSMDDVIHQPALPPGLPETWDGLAQSPISGDYEMDPEVVTDPAYADDLRAGLRAIPTLSIVMSPDDLWSAEDGIYIHSTQRGEAWERPTSMELIEPAGASVQADCGVRIHGYGWRPHANTRKHSLRLEFRSEYGPSKLEYPLFPEAPVTRFDSIVLRSQGSRGWQDFRDPEQAQYIRDAFARDTAAAMGKADGHAAYVHLFLNGLYWGLYMAVERPDADFGAERFGGEDEEYDAINRRTTTNEAIDGNLDAYHELLERSDADLTDASHYGAVAELVDMDDLIDYMLIHQYTTNRDGPEQFSHNNMRGVRRRLDGERFRFFVWDMEYSLWYATDHINIDVDVAGSASHVYARLRSNPDFRARYAERAAMHLTGDGALTPEATLARWEARAIEIEDAVVAESARWGDTDRALPYTRDVEWAEERRRLTEEYFPARTAVLIEQLEAAGLY